MRWRNTLTILVLLTVTSLPTFAQWRWGRPARPRSGACFYRHKNFRGKYFCIPSGRHWARLPRDMNDNITSVSVHGGARVRIFRDPEFHGPSRLIDRDIRRLRRLNNRASSIVVFGGVAPRRQGGRDRDRDYDRDRDRNYDRY
jgi:hypothetical protein